ncbi:CAD [Branchiostoma lanceolatum]|uniref:allantoinase n=1 Tax=Branchiostoma lanceolatum TaxID=7740 RepID=A0A8J9YSP0_BRALA|nr:CAD [Branchiostoma lanceolatum]
MLGETQLLLTLTGAALYLFHHRGHLPRLIWRPYVLLLSGIGTVLFLKDTSYVFCFLAWLIFVCLHYFKELQKGNESECCICLEDLKTSCPYECTRCKKATHARCVVDYLEQSGERSFRCPFCRKDMKVNKEQLKMAIENFHRLLGNTEVSDEQGREGSTSSEVRKKKDLELSWEDQVEDEITENPDSSSSPGQEPRPATRPSVVTATKTITIVSLMVTFHGSYQLFRDSYRILPADLKKFGKVFLEDAKVFVRGPLMMCVQQLYNGAAVAAMYLYNSVFNSSGRVKRLVYGALEKVTTLATQIWYCTAMAMVRRGTMGAANYLVNTFPAHAFNFTMQAYHIGEEGAHRIWHSRFMTELREDVTVLSYFTFVTLPVFFKDMTVSVWYSRPMQLARQKTEICIKDGVITEIRKGNNSSFEAGLEVIDAGDLYVMPGVVDSHVHVNEPGRTEWEGYVTATRAAAAGGITTIVDMPLNSIPSTTTLDAFQTKMDTARDKLYVDVAFWGGVVPGNQGELQAMIAAGISGFKCFLIHSGVDEFRHVTEPDLHTAMQTLQGTNSVLLFHAEVDQPIGAQTSTSPQVYETFLQSRPKAMENHAIQLVSDMCQQYGVRCHIVHLSSAEALPIIRAAKQRGLPLTVETCHHYLTLCAEDIPDRATQFKCCPPVRERSNQACPCSGLTPLRGT